MNNALGYSRLSDVGTIDTQNKQIISYCQINNLNLLNIFSDDGVSAGTFNRPQWIALEKYLAKSKGEIQYIIVSNSDRFSRDDFLFTMTKRRELQLKYKLKILSVTDSLDLDVTDPLTELMQTIQAFTNWQERQKTIERQLNSQANKKSKGFYPHKAPIGYLNQKSATSNTNLVVDETKAKGIRELFLTYSRTGSAEQARRAAAELGVIVKGNSAIKVIIANPLYCGKIKVPETKFTRGEIKQGIHEPIISIELWDLCQSINSPKNNNKYAVDEVPLRGALRCWCGQKLTAGRSKGRSKHYWYYLCSTHKENLSADKLHKQFDEILEVLSFSEAEVESIKSGVIKALDTLENPKEIKALKEAIKNTEAKIKNTETKYLTTTGIDENTYKEVIGNLKRELTHQKIELERITTNKKIYIDRLNEIIPKLTNLKVAFELLPIEKKSYFIKTIFGAVLYYREGIYRTTNPTEIILLKSLILNNKGLLKIEQPFVNFDGLPSVPRNGMEPLLALRRTGC